MRTSIFGIVTGTLVFFSVGVLCLAKAQYLQNLALNYQKQMPLTLQLRVVKDYIGSGAFIVVTRLVGILSVIASLLYLFFAIRLYLRR